MNDLFLYVGILIFFFVLWVYAGGPNQPFSFSGPYITPITNVGVSSIGYGNDSKVGQYFSNNTTVPGRTITASDRSPYAGKVRLEGGNINTTDPRQEYLTVRSTTNEDISISGWQLVSEKSGTRAVLPIAANIARIGGAQAGDLSNVILSSGTSAIVNSGASPLGNSFRETKCTGYLDTSGVYYPSLRTNSCPDPLTELSDQYSRESNEYRNCRDYVTSYGSCRVGDTDSRNMPGTCRTFINLRLNYDRCVQNHKNDGNFRSDTWRLFLLQRNELWFNSSDTIELRDTNGKVVDLYSY